MINLRIIIITGMSGSGKSTALDAFEDAGYYCVDNLPMALLPKFLELPVESDSEIAGLAFVMDLREKGFLSNFPEVFEALRQKGYRWQVLFLESKEETLLQRYSQTRRQHPLSESGSLIDSIRKEKEQLKAVRVAADKVIDTSHYNVHDLKRYILDIAHKSKVFVSMRINVMSFGFKYGAPREADLVLDVRFLANPYFVPALKDKNGTDADVSQYVLDRDITRLFLEKYLDILDFLIPLYRKEGKAYLTIAIGCTGGRHRSVAVAEAIHAHLQKTKVPTNCAHRDIEL
jgi:RNase adapter protein RapZ